MMFNVTDNAIYDSYENFTFTNLLFNFTDLDYDYWNISNNSTYNHAVDKQSDFQQMSATEIEIFIILASVCIILTAIGNILVILSVFTYPPLKSVQNYYIVSLAGADMAVAVLVMPFNIAYTVSGGSNWQFGLVWCNIWLTLDILCCTASILHLCAIAIDRYYAIHDPINYALLRTSGRVLSKILFVWLISAVISIPPLFGWNNSSSRSLYDETSGRCQLTDERSYVLFSGSSSFYIPLAIMSFVYVKIYLATRARLRGRARGLGRLQNVALTASPSCYISTAETIRTRLSASDDRSVRDNTARNDNECAIPSVVSVANDALQPDAELGEISNSNSLHNLSVVQNTAKLEDLPDGSNPDAPQTETLLNKTSLQASKENVDVVKFSFSTSKNSNINAVIAKKQRISLTKERRAARTMGIIMGAFIVCWLPFFLMYVIFPFCSKCSEAVDLRLVLFIVWLGYVNSALNPIIYTVFNIDFRRAFFRLLFGRCRRKKKIGRRLLA